MRDYIPSKDSDLVGWSQNFADVITAAPTDYGLIAGQASAYDTLNTAYADAYAAAINPGTRTPVTVAAKDTARNELVASARSLAQVARRYPGITNELLSDAGLTVPDPIPSPVPAPVTQPVLSLLSSSSLKNTLRFKDSVLANPRSKPQGVVSMQLFQLIGLTPPSDISECKFVGNFSRMPAEVNYSGDDALKNAYYLARWVNAKGQVGPQSALFSQTIAA